MLSQRIDLQFLDGDFRDLNDLLTQANKFGQGTTGKEGSIGVYYITKTENFNLFIGFYNF